jgi:hypothetical protein
MMTFDDLLAAARQDPENTDFAALRLAYTQSPGYAPYEQDRETGAALQKALEEVDLQAARTAVDQLLAHNYLNIDAHMTAAHLYRRLDDLASVDYHRQFGHGLLKSIFRSGDGRSFETAWVVIAVAEEYAVCMALGDVETESQRLVEHEDHRFDVLTVRHPRTQETRELTFNVDLPMDWAERHYE